MTDRSLALALVEAIAADPDALAKLKEMVETKTEPDPPLAYAVQALALETGLSPKAVRGAIQRGELHATRRGGSRGPYLISGSEAHAWLNRVHVPKKRVAATPSVRARQSRPMASALESLDTSKVDDQ
jgi:hypothetical protein